MCRWLPGRAGGRFWNHDADDRKPSRRQPPRAVAAAAAVVNVWCVSASGAICSDENIQLQSNKRAPALVPRIDITRTI